MVDYQDISGKPLPLSLLVMSMSTVSGFQGASALRRLLALGMVSDDSSQRAPKCHFSQRWMQKPLVQHLRTVAGATKMCNGLISAFIYVDIFPGRGGMESSSDSFSDLPKDLWFSNSL